MCSSLSTLLAQLTSPVYTRRSLMPPLLLVSQHLQSFFLQDTHRVLRSGQMSVWGNAEVRYLPLGPRRDAGRLGTAPFLGRQTCLTNCGPQCNAGPFSFCCQPSLPNPHCAHCPRQQGQQTQPTAQDGCARCPAARLTLAEPLQGRERKAETAGRKTEITCVQLGEKRE